MSEKKGKTLDKETGQEREVLVTDEELAALEPKPVVEEVVDKKKSR